jgi:hypothetical protein
LWWFVFLVCVVVWWCVFGLLGLVGVVCCESCVVGVGVVGVVCGFCWVGGVGFDCLGVGWVGLW